MGSGTKIKWNAFMTVAEEFAEQMKAVSDDIDNQVNSYQAKAAKNLVTA